MYLCDILEEIISKISKLKVPGPVHDVHENHTDDREEIALQILQTGVTEKSLRKKKKMECNSAHTAGVH